MGTLDTKIVKLFKTTVTRLSGTHCRARSIWARRIHDLFQENPFLISNALVQKPGLSTQTVNAALADLEKLGIVEEIT